MKFKEGILEKLDILNENMDTVKTNMERHSMSAEQVYEAFSEVQSDLSQIRALINRE